MENCIYINDETNANRFVLGYEGKSTILCIGVNPSTATPEEPDRTIRSVERISEYNGYDGWMMVNLYPQRATNPEDIDIHPSQRLIERNLREIQAVISTYNISEIWAAWGNLIDRRPYLIECLKGIYSITSEHSWVCFGDSTKEGNPRHPLYLKTSSEKHMFDIDGYIRLKQSTSKKEKQQ